jgi:hypothetical protein
MLPVAVWAPAEVLKAGGLNPFRRHEDSEAMRAHKASWAARRFRVMAGG